MNSVHLRRILIIAISAPMLLSGINKTPVSSSFSKKIVSPVVVYRSEAEVLYDSLGLEKLGLNKTAFLYAWKGYKTLINNGEISKSIISICDFSQSSRKKRLYVLDLHSRRILMNTYVAHGRNSGNEYARSFSNKPESLKSSLGFFVTRNTYWGNKGLALNMEGLEEGINDNANERRIVVHGSSYIGASYLKTNHKMGRSFGCPAVSDQEINKLVRNIKGGTCFFIYHPSKNYLKKSRIINS